MASLFFLLLLFVYSKVLSATRKTDSQKENSSLKGYPSCCVSSAPMSTYAGAVAVLGDHVVLSTGSILKGGPDGDLKEKQV